MAEDEYPCVLYSHGGKHYKKKTFWSISSDRRRTRSIPTLKHKTPVGCVQGWLFLLADDDRPSSDDFRYNYSMWNPVTSQFIELPLLIIKLKQFMRRRTTHIYLESYVLSSPPGEPDSTVFLFFYHIYSFFMCRLSDLEWVEIPYAKAMRDSGSSKDDFLQLQHAVWCNGKLYAERVLKLSEERFVSQLLVVEVSSSDNRLVLVPQNSSGASLLPNRRVNYSFLYNEHVIESGGELFAVHVHCHGQIRGAAVMYEQLMDVNVYKLNFSTMIWEDVYDLTDRALFIACNRSVGSYHAPPDRSSLFKKNCVYFILDNGESLYSYHLEDGTVSISLPRPNLLTPRLRPVWIMPKEDHDHKLQGKDDDHKETIIMQPQAKERMLFSLTDFPLGVLQEIGEKTFLFDYMNFREICRDCRLVSAAPKQYWKTCQLTPWLVFSPKGKDKCCLVNPFQHDRCCIETPELLKDPVVRCSKDSWLLLSTSQSVGEEKKFPILLFNPFTKAIIQLPDLPDERVVGFSISRPACSDNFLVLGVVMMTEPDVGILLTSPGEKEWRYYQFETRPDFSPSYNNPVFWKGDFVFLDQNGNVEALRVPTKKDGLYWTRYWGEDPKSPCSSSHQNFLVELKTNLISVFVGHLGKWVRVFKLVDEWEEVDDLEGYTIYVSTLSSFSALAKVPGTDNRIYFPRFYGESQSLVFYSLNTRQFHASSGSSSCCSSGKEEEDTSIDYCDTREQLLCGWTQPARRSQPP